MMSAVLEALLFSLPPALWSASCLELNDVLVSVSFMHFCLFVVHAGCRRSPLTPALVPPVDAVGAEYTVSAFAWTRTHKQKK